MGRTLVIAEPGMTWDRDLSKAFRLIDAAKACDADVCKFQWTSSGKALAKRRNMPQYESIYERGVQYPREWLEKLKSHCDSVGIEFACTTYLIEDIAVVAPLVERFKVSAYESKWLDFIKAHPSEPIISCRDINDAYGWNYALKCVSKYPTPIDELGLRYLRDERDSNSPFAGLSDHTANVLTGAAAVAAGASIVEAHIKLHDTPKDNPDYPHSLIATPLYEQRLYNSDYEFTQYVSNIRTVERML